jgi:hypothetical protein
MYPERRPLKPVSVFAKKSTLMDPVTSMVPPYLSRPPTCPVVQAFICHTERRKTKREYRRLADIIQNRNRIIANSLIDISFENKKEK